MDKICWCGSYPVVYSVLSIPPGVGFLPSTASTRSRVSPKQVCNAASFIGNNSKH